MNKSIVGMTVALVGAPAESSNPDGFLCVPDETHLTGLYVVDEFVPYEPSAYVHEPGFIVADCDTVQDNYLSFFVSADEFEKQVWPKLYGSKLLQERESEFAAEDFEETRRCVGCFNMVRPRVASDHARGCPTGQNGSPNYE